MRSAQPEAPPLVPSEGPDPVSPGTEPEQLTWVGSADVAVLAHRVLPLEVLRRLAKWQGRLIYWLRPGQAEVLRTNLAPFARPGESAASLARRFLEDQQIRRLLLILAARLTTEELRELAPLRGLERLERVCAEGKGAILLLSHLHSTGGFLVVILLRRLGYPISESRCCNLWAA